MRRASKDRKQIDERVVPGQIEVRQVGSHQARFMVRHDFARERLEVRVDYQGRQVFELEIVAQVTWLQLRVYQQEVHAPVQSVHKPKKQFEGSALNVARQEWTLNATRASSLPCVDSVIIG